jgi:sialate O-acetylesterase
MVLFLLFVVLLGRAHTGRAEVRLPHLLSDHAVLQRESPIHIWGWAEAGEQIKVSFHAQTVKTTTDQNGTWSILLKPESAGGPYTLQVSGSKTENPVTREDILVGDVWVASGQSNMGFPLKGGGPSAPLKDGDKEIADSNQPQIRLFREAMHLTAKSWDDLPEQWTPCTPENAKSFSAVAYFFGRHIVENEHIPVGLVEASVGGTPVQTWISPEGSKYSSLSAVTDYATELMKRSGTTFDSAVAAGDRTLQADWMPSSLYNGMIAPLTPYTIKGAIWYQGESDAGSVTAPGYLERFTALIQDWRQKWGEGDFPFLYVQISSVGGQRSYWGNIRDAQRRALHIANTAMATSLDVGRSDSNPHPSDKQTVAARLANAALGMVYGEKVEYQPPLFEKAAPEGHNIRAWFSHADGLRSSDNPVKDFEVAGADHKFVPATAHIEQVGSQETVVAQAFGVTMPKYIRYGWSSFVGSYLYNSSHLPMGAFTSEEEQPGAKP